MTLRARMEWLAAVLTFNFILGIVFAKQLWIAARFYPLAPAFAALAAIPPWVDYVLTPLFIFLLVANVIAPRRKIFLALALATVGFLFLQDQGRLFPSFYEYSLLLCVLLFYRPAENTDVSAPSSNGAAILEICRLAIAFVYIWSGIQKLNPLFVNDFSWFMLPVTHALPFIKSMMPALFIIAPLIEISFGAGLLIKRTRKYAMWGALAMHTGILLLIGPLRGNWNDSAWAWNVGSALLVFTLFFRSWRDAAHAEPARPALRAHWLAWVVIAFFGVMPLFSLFNLWDSALSFDVYSGNYFSAQMYVTQALAAQFPPQVATHVLTLGTAAPQPSAPSSTSLEPFDVYAWSQESFNANPYPSPRVFQNILHSLCSYGSHASASTTSSTANARLVVYDKLHLVWDSGLRWTDGIQTYDCHSR